MSSEARVRRTLLANVPAVAVLFSLSWVVGMALYAVYKYCDPLTSSQIAAPDEVLPFYVQDQFGFLPGMLGLFLGSLFNGALRLVRVYYFFFSFSLNAVMIKSRAILLLKLVVEKLMTLVNIITPGFSLMLFYTKKTSHTLYFKLPFGHCVS